VFVVRRFHNFAPYLRPLRGFEPYGTLLQSSQRTGFGCQILREAGDVTPTELDTLPAFTLQLRDSQLPPDYQGWGTLLSAECSQLHTAGLLYSERRLLDSLYFSLAAVLISGRIVRLPPILRRYPHTFTRLPRKRCTGGCRQWGLFTRSKKAP